LRNGNVRLRPKSVVQEYAIRQIQRRIDMTLCPIALVAGCEKCPALNVCPLKGVIGDYRKPGEAQTKTPADRGEGGAKRKP
jgi:hypothetical protein